MLKCFKFIVDTDELDVAIEQQIYQELAERGIHKDCLSDWHTMLIVVVYYD